MKLNYSIAKTHKYVDSVHIQERLYIGALIIDDKKCVRFVKAIEENTFYGKELVPYFESKVFLYENALNLSFDYFENVFLIREKVSMQLLLSKLNELKF